MCVFNLLGDTLEHAREILRQEIITLPCNPILLKALVSMDHTCVTALRGQSDHSHSPRSMTATLSAFPDSVPDDYVTRIHLDHFKRVDVRLLSEYGPGLISGAVTMDVATFTTFLSLAGRASAMSWFNRRVIPDTRLSQSFIRYECTSTQIRQCNAMSSPLDRKRSMRL